jgi:hypothetical protein
MNLCPLNILVDFVLTMPDGWLFKVNHGKFLQYWKIIIQILYIPKSGMTTWCFDFESKLTF